MIWKHISKVLWFFDRCRCVTNWLEAASLDTDTFIRHDASIWRGCGGHWRQSGHIEALKLNQAEVQQFVDRLDSISLGRPPTLRVVPCPHRSSLIFLITPIMRFKHGKFLLNSTHRFFVAPANVPVHFCALNATKVAHICVMLLPRQTEFI